jgi:aspartyl-tRNA(Asn)/glutamyl-tRNA(Gln) amidotransferase subunit A
MGAPSAPEGRDRRNEDGVRDGHSVRRQRQDDDMATEIEQIAKRSAAGIGLAFRSGEAHPVQLAEYLIDRIAQSDDPAIFISTTAGRAMREAEASLRRHNEGRPLSPLDGVPIAWKDLIDVAGARTTAASETRRGSPVKDRDARCVAHAAAAGLVCLGKVNLTEFAYSGLGLNPHFGTPVNPNDTGTKRVPGGSSSGSGVAIASGLAPCSIGTDTGGSVRIPAALNGVFGFKTSEGRIDKQGVVPLSRTLDTVGPLGRSVEDLILLDMILRGEVVPSARRQDLRAVTIVVAENVVFERCGEAVVDNFDRAIRRIEAAGARIERRRLPVIDEMSEVTARHGSLTGAESYHEYHALLDSPEGRKVDSRVVHRMMMGARMSAFSLLTIQSAREKAKAEIARELEGAVLAMPTTAITAPEIAPLEADVDRFHEINLLMLRNTMIGNNLAMCGLAMPTGRDGNDLPTSILFNAPHGRDDFLLGLGLEFERVLGDLFEPTWARR